MQDVPDGLVEQVQPSAPAAPPESPRQPRWLGVVACAAMAGAFLSQLGQASMVDLDIFHEMALFREALHLGCIPTADSFAYTPTVNPSIQHEWGSGTVFYLIVQSLGSGG